MMSIIDKEIELRGWEKKVNKPNYKVYIREDIEVNVFYDMDRNISRVEASRMQKHPILNGIKYCKSIELDEMDSFIFEAKLNEIMKEIIIDSLLEHTEALTKLGESQFILWNKKEEK